MASREDERLLGDFQHRYWRSAQHLDERLPPLSPDGIDDDQFRLFAENIPTLCWMAKGDGYIVWYNRRWHEYCGTTPEAMEGWGWQSVHDPEVLPTVMERWTQSIATGEPFEMTFPLKGADGIFRPFLTRVQPVRDGSGEVVRWFGVNTEIAAQHAAEQALRESEERLRLVQAAGGIGSFDYDVRRDEAICSEEWYKLYGLPAGTPIKLKRMSSVVVAEDWPQVTQTLEQAIAERKSLSVEYRIIREDNGELRWLMSSATMLLDPEGQPWRYVGGVVDITERHLAAETIRESEERLRLVLDAAPGGFYAVDREGNTTLVSRGFLDMLGFDEQDAIGRKLHDVIHHSRPDGAHYPVEECPIYQCAATGKAAHVPDELFFRLDGAAVPVEYWATPINRAGEHVGASCTIVDLTERKKVDAALRELNDTLEQRVREEIERRSEAEEALRQSQKMETVGQLTGGIAHDFNNLLQVVTGNLDILSRKIPDKAAPLRRYAERAMVGAKRAATLTQRLLAFSRRQPLAPKPTDVTRLVPGMSELLHRTLGETIEVEAVLPPRVWLVETDQNQLENAILNLALNARDAMPDGGKLTIEAQNTHLDEGYASQHPGVAPGQYVVICITDTGTGMDEDTATKAIEPFFTTKEVGKGTGLGLSMVYGFIKQSGGHLKIYSEPGDGTTVKIYLPRLVGKVAVSEDQEQPAPPTGSAEEAILVCEDDEEVRAYSAEVLRELGYHVLEASDGPAALEILRNDGTEVDLLFTDVVLPGGMSGAMLAKEAAALRPALKTLFTTGYARNAIVHQGRLDPGVELITKPFSYADLAVRIRDLLDRTP